MRITSLIIDMDGVLWRADQPIGDLPAIFDRIEQLGLQFVLATNNSSRTPAQYVEKLQRFGVSIAPTLVLTSAIAAAMYLHRRFPQGGKVYIIGEQGLYQALQEKGFQPDHDNALAVVVGIDRQFNYTKLSQATRLVRNGALLIGTNPDRTFPTPEGLAPGAGTQLAALEAATDVQPIITGKPQPEMYRVALDILGATPEETLVIGDRPETDIAGGQSLGCRTALVLSGVTTPEAARQWSPPPDLILPDLRAVVEALA
jgi:4-nitrophenyl phosphatase